MIDLLQAPVQDSILWDANKTRIQVKSYRGDSHYFRASIAINDVPFITQNWSKNSEGIAQQDLQLFYYNYFNHIFNEVATAAPSITALDHLKRKVSITIEECAVGTTTAVETLSLPDYHILFTERPVLTEPQDELILLDEVNNLKVPSSAKYRMTFYSPSQSITYAIKDQSNNDVVTATSHSIDESGVFTFDVSLPELNLSSSVTSLQLIISDGANQIIQTLELSGKRLYRTKSVYYRTDYGSYQVAYLYGQQANEHEFNRDSYLDNSLSPVTHYVEDMEMIEIASSNGLISLTPLLHNILRSIDVKLYLDNLWTSIHCTTDQLLRKVEREYIYQETLKFTRHNFKDVETGQYIPIPDILDITITGDENTLFEITQSQLTTASNGFTFDRVRIIEPSSVASIGYSTATSVEFTNQSTTPPPFIPVELELSEFVNLLYKPNYGQNGQPLDSLMYQLGNGTIWSNPANLIFNVTDLNPGNSAPIISFNTSSFTAGLNASGNGSAFLNTTVVDPDNDNFNLLWEELNGAPITFSDATTEDTIITITNGVVGTTYQVRLTATDINGNSSFQIFDILATNLIVTFSSSINFGESSNNITVYDVVISGLPQGESVDIYAESATTLVGQAYRINYLTAQEVAASSYQRLVRQTYTSVDGNDFTVKIAFDNISVNSDAKLFLSLEKPTGGAVIKDGVQKLELIPAV